MQTYTYGHMIQVFVFGIIYGCLIVGAIAMTVKKRRHKQSSQVKEPAMAEVIPLKRKIPSAGTTEYRSLSTKY